ncbi:uncharacterized protein I206_104131 [Kwoniella pini CBS 10737]|uniref:Uncharacterized protein n=1 Tax=Kwoniella pini CBS 10737 TaxID=1296096 RepID=A0A1B9I2S5_9TREE|nr:uncharacterized protein I206_04293 [Kwoniella pini CBS 10737]OCF49768.1 hypothetical protein I206_04293 [Kwoniella pini CBS 10737]
MSSSSSSSIASSSRPLTPFPHTHTLTHGSGGSYFHHIQFEVQPHKYTSQPIHFAIKKPLSTPTPPSLIRRSSSNSKRIMLSPTLRATSSSSSSSTSEMIAPIPRRVSSSSSSSSSRSSRSISSPPMPITPVLESPTAPPPTPLSLPPPLNQFKIQTTTTTITEIIEIENEYNSFNYDPYSISLSNGEEIASTSSLSNSKILKRPKFKRRDTPIPKTTTLSSLKMYTFQDEYGRKILRSVIDGGNWVIVD